MNALRSRPWALLFLVSLALNLFLGGMLFARWLHRPGGGGPMGFGPMSFGALSPEARPAAERVWANRKGEISQRARAAREARRHAADALSAEPFDASKASAALADSREKARAVEESMNAAMVELAAALPADQRAKLRQSLDRSRGLKGRKHPGWEGLGSSSGVTGTPPMPTPSAP